MNTLQSSNFVEGIQAGDHIDVRDCEGDWFEAGIISVDRKIAKCHFINYSSKWDCNILLSDDNIAMKNSHSKSTGKPDNYKYLLECVHEVLYIRNENDNYVHSAKEIGIGAHELESFINRGEPQNDEEKIKILKWVRAQSCLMRLNLKILEIDDVINVLCPPADILASCFNNVSKRITPKKRVLSSSDGWSSSYSSDDEVQRKKRKKRKYKKRTKMFIDENEVDDFSEFKIVLSDANLNLNHSIYPNRKFRGIAKSGRRWRARTCIVGKTQYGDKSFYNPFLAAMEYDRMIRANRQQELIGAIKTKTQIILNFPYGLQQQTIRIHKLFEKELQQMDGEQIKRTFGVKYKDDDHIFESKRKRKKDAKRKEEPIIDNCGLETKIPIEFLKKMDSALYQTDRLKPFGPIHIALTPMITHYVANKKNNNVKPQNIDEWRNGTCQTSLFFGYRTLHIASNK